MRTYIIRRLLLIIPTLFVATLITFAFIRFIPGDAIDMMVKEGEWHTQASRDQIKEQLGLTQPIWVQYGRWVAGIFTRFDFGLSYWSKTPVTGEVVQALPVTLELGIMSFVWALIVSLPVGIFSAIRQDTLGDYAARSFAIGLMAIPGFWIGTMVIVFPSIWWGWSPPIFLIKFSEDPLGNIGMFIIPALINGAGMSAGVMRMTRTMMLEVLRQDYIRTAWSKGLEEKVVIVRHGLKNAFIPVITLIGFQIPALVGGSLIIENLFNLPGMGRLFVQSAFTRDYPMISAAMFLMAVVILFSNLLTDLTYAALDPRIKYE